MEASNDSSRLTPHGEGRRHRRADGGAVPALIAPGWPTLSAMEPQAAMAPEPRDRGLWTIPNLISALRLLAIPWFVWLLLHEHRPIAAGILLAALGGTDWIDGYIARHFDQGSKIGKIMDPIADRALLIVGAVALLIDGTVPRWIGVIVLFREALVSLATVSLAALGARRIDVQWVGKAGTLAMMFSLPLFLWLDTVKTGTGHHVLAAVTWFFTVTGIVLSYYATAGYIPIGLAALREGRESRERAHVGAGTGPETGGTT